MKRIKLCKFCKIPFDRTGVCLKCQAVEREGNIIYEEVKKEEVKKDDGDMQGL